MSSDPRRHLGTLGEELACDHLERLGYSIVERNHRTRHGELDVIAFDARAAGTLVFCEVKTRRASRTAFDSINGGKRSRIRQLAAAWLAEGRERPRAADLRFDAIGVTIDPAGRVCAIDHLEGAF